MARGNVGVYKVHFKGDNDDFIVFVENPSTVKEWRKDRSIPLAQVVNGWKIFVTHHQGSQGILDGASKSVIESEFGTSDDSAAMAAILEKGEIQETENGERNGSRNDSKGIYIPR